MTTASAKVWGQVGLSHAGHPSALLHTPVSLPTVQNGQLHLSYVLSASY